MEIEAFTTSLRSSITRPAPSHDAETALRALEHCCVIIDTIVELSEHTKPSPHLFDSYPRSTETVDTVNAFTDVADFLDSAPEIRSWWNCHCITHGLSSCIVGVGPKPLVAEDTGG